MEIDDVVVDRDRFRFRRAAAVQVERMRADLLRRVVWLDGGFVGHGRGPMSAEGREELVMGRV